MVMWSEKADPGVAAGATSNWSFWSVIQAMRLEMMGKISESVTLADHGCVPLAWFWRLVSNR